MVVGEDVTVGADDDTAAQSGLGLRGLVTKEELEPGSLLRGWRTALLVLMLTTAGDALRAAPLKLPAAGCPAGAGALPSGPRRARAGGALADPVGLEGGDNKIGRGENRHGLREQQPDAFHDE